MLVGYLMFVRISAALAERLSVLALMLGYYYTLMTGNLFVKGEGNFQNNLS